MNLKTTFVNGYYITGNKHIAIAISLQNEDECESFTMRDKPGDWDYMSAFDRAIAWTETRRQ